MTDNDPAFSSLAPTPSLAESSDPLTAGIKALLDPSIRSTTDKLSEVYLAQQELGGELGRLVSLLQNYLDTTDPPMLRQTVLKLAATQKRLKAVNTSLANIQTRVNRIYVQLSKQRSAAGGS